MFDLEQEVRSWRGELAGTGAFLAADLSEMESHLREEVDGLRKVGLDDEESFLIAVKRIGKVSQVAGEFARARTERLWKYLSAPADDEVDRLTRRERIMAAVLMAGLAALLAIIPQALGLSPFSRTPADYGRFAALFLLVPATLLLARFHQPPRRQLAAIGVVFLAFAAAALFFPAFGPGQTRSLFAIHAPIALWLLILPVYAGAGWKSGRERMDYLRLSGEAAIYTVLIYSGGAVLIAFLRFIFASISIDVMQFTQRYVMLAGAFAAPIVAIYLVEEKRNIVENIAPVLAAIFAPLFLVAIVGFLAASAFTARAPLADREFLIGVDLALVLVVALVVYTISARKPKAAPGIGDYITAALILATLMLDVLALVAIVARLGEFGGSPNKIAALGENVALLVNLAGLCVAYVRFLAGGRRQNSDETARRFGAIVRWQTAFLPVYALWTAAVALLFPVIFGFR